MTQWHSERQNSNGCLSESTTQQPMGVFSMDAEAEPTGKYVRRTIGCSGG
ncbi:hypothetical protein SIN8267_01857 [Sinobacterium norvegicum]|uniref:Uncharacterized protein n=1 Tax=Sinobacterium norvegicum TaxID=1641715 RepID=A0ABM9AEW9_9GAMM|nr:hypothetical protein [Sinobacterium norvegicum]CAH0991743.1 hypothetical protein SIN8267_01857 [Sinobacterium norvegicum]